MSNPLYQQMMPQNNIMNQINQLKTMYKDPNQVIQSMLNSGKVTQAQYNAAVQRAQGIARMLGMN